REIWRSSERVEPPDGRGTRSALTAIYFLLPAGAVSRWHRVRSDELWQHVEGAPLELALVPPDASRIERRLLGPLAPEQEPMLAVPADCWQAARSLGSYTLVVCTVGPGFEFADFEMMSDRELDTLCETLPGATAYR
ncbi:MAG TPA: cupin domain-containing protein, partial [Candidatus Polarisedimenticolaceae bacterium]|nr:cupin domain-containing protein [Candidatus Polarisedimenticolaceae bacterium]